MRLIFFVEILVVLNLTEFWFCIAINRYGSPTPQGHDEGNFIPQKVHPDCVTLRGGRGPRGTRGEEDEFFPNVDNCQSFFLCRKGQLRPYPLTCPFPTQFNSRRKGCVWMGRFDCPKSKSPQAIIQKKGASVQFNPYTEPKYQSQSIVSDFDKDPYPNPTVTSNQETTRTTSYYPSPRAHSSPSDYSPSETLPPLAGNALTSTPTSTSYKATSALQNWINWAFISSYGGSNLVPPPSEVRLGSAVWDRLSRDGKGGRGLASAVSSISLNTSMTGYKDRLERMLNQGYFSEEEVLAQTSIISGSGPEFFHTIRETVVADDDPCAAELIYGLRGLVQISSTSLTVLASWQRFKLSVPAANLALIPTQDCILEGQFCKSELVLGDLDRSLAQYFLSFMRATALEQFNEDQAVVLEKLSGEVVKGVKYLPEEVKANWDTDSDETLIKLLRNGEKIVHSQ